MAKELGFEQKIEGLLSYHQALTQMDPSNPEHNAIANPEFFYYAGGHHVVSPLTKAKEGVLYDIGCHARVEYGVRRFETKDLRTDNEQELVERADVLSVMTSPLTPEVRKDRADRLVELLGAIAEGGIVISTEYNNFYRQYDDPQEFAVDPNRALFAVFLNGHISSRDLTFQYDSPHTQTAVKPGEPIFTVNVLNLFANNPAKVAVYPTTVVL